MLRFTHRQPATIRFNVMVQRIAAVTDIPLAERRLDVRRRVFKGGVIIFDGTGIDCTVRNLSDGGAALDVANGAAIPPRFRLSIRADDFVARCRMIWNDGRRVGIAFD